MILRAFRDVVTPLTLMAVVLTTSGCPRPDPRAPEAPATESDAAAGVDAPVVREVEIRGATVFTPEKVRQIVRVSPGGRLRRSPADVAQSLQSRYRTTGYPAATVSGAFDAATGVLRLVVDEGRLGEVVLEGVSDAGRERALAALGLERGVLLTEALIRGAITKLEDASSGALTRAGHPPYTAEPGADGARLVIRMVEQRVRLGFVPGGPGVAPPFNRVDGFAPWVGAELTVYDPRAYNHLSAYGRIGYGFRSHDPRFTAGVLRPFGANRRVTIGYEFHDLTDSDDAFRASLFEEGPAIVQPLGDSGDYFRRRGHEGYAFVSVRPTLQVGLGFRADRYESLAGWDEDAGPDHRENPAIGGGDMQSFIGSVRFSRGGPLWSNLRAERESFLDRSLYGTRLQEGAWLRGEATVENAAVDYDFRRAIVNVRALRTVSPRLALRGRGLLGLSSGDLPLHRQFALGGIGTLRGRPLKYRVGDHMALLNAEAALSTAGRWPGLVAFYDGGSTWTSGFEGDGWDHDLGVGLEWPAGNGFFARVDGACAVNDAPANEDRCRVTGRIRLPF